VLAPKFRIAPKTSHLIYVHTFRKDPACASPGILRKTPQNVRRHGIAFRDAARIFDGATVERVDDRYDYGEVVSTPLVSSMASRSQ
jgi:hypothetical protein